MKIGELTKLVDCKKFTNVPLYAHFADNPEVLENMSIDSLVAMDLFTEPAFAVAIKENGLSVLPSYGGMDLATFLAKVAAGGEIVLDNNIVLEDYIEIRNDVTINLNGYSIVHPATSKSKYPDVFEVLTGGKLTINGDGEVIAENGYAVYASSDAVVTLNDGYYFSPVSAVDARKNASVTINGGVFKVDGTNNPDGDFGQKFTLNLRDKKGNYVNELSEIVVKGGKFYKYNPAASESEPEITNFVATGYEAVADGDWFIVKELDNIVVDEL